MSSVGRRDRVVKDPLSPGKHGGQSGSDVGMAGRGTRERWRDEPGPAERAVEAKRIWIFVSVLLL